MNNNNQPSSIIKLEKANNDTYSIQKNDLSQLVEKLNGNPLYEVTLTTTNGFLGFRNSGIEIQIRTASENFRRDIYKADLSHQEQLLKFELEKEKQKIIDAKRLEIDAEREKHRLAIDAEKEKHRLNMVKYIVTTIIVRASLITFFQVSNKCQQQAIVTSNFEILSIKY